MLLACHLLHQGSLQACFTKTTVTIPDEETTRLPFSCTFSTRGQNLCPGTMVDERDAAAEAAVAGTARGVEGAPSELSTRSDGSRGGSEKSGEAGASRSGPPAPPNDELAAGVSGVAQAGHGVSEPQPPGATGLMNRRH